MQRVKILKETLTSTTCPVCVGDGVLLSGSTCSRCDGVGRISVAVHEDITEKVRRFKSFKKIFLI